MTERDHFEHLRAVWPTAGLSLLLLAGCGSGASAADHREEHEHEGADAEPSHEEGTDEHGEHGADLDQPVEALFAESCEHGVLTHACDECRYEVGVARVPKELIEQGLIEIAEVKRRDFDGEIELTGEIGFDERRIVHLSPRATGVVREVLIDVGQRVKAGQVLVELESAELARAESAYLAALAERRLAQKAFDRKQQLQQAGIGSEREFLEARQALEAASISSDSARMDLVRLGHDKRRLAALARRGSKGATGRLLVTASLDGEVLSLHAVRGERIEPGDAFLLVGDVGALWLWVDLYETQLEAITRARADGEPRATARVAAFRDKRFEGRMDFVERVMDEHTRTVKARITLDNPGGELRPGMFVTVRLAVGAGSERLAVPPSAVLSDDGRDFVFVRFRDDYYVRRPVTRGREADGLVEISGELEPGQQVAAKGAFLLKSDVLRSKMGAGCAD